MQTMPDESQRLEVASLGEALVRFSVPLGHRLPSARSLDIHVAGAEINVCAALAGLGRRAGWISRLPDNPLGQLILRRAREWGVDTRSLVLTSDGRVGTYFIEPMSPPLPTRVTYDRSSSAFSRISSGEIDWDYLLSGKVLHLTGITPALSASCLELTGEAIARAKDAGLMVSFDVNYRSRLWEPQTAAECLLPLIRDVDLLICGQKDARLLFGLDGDASDLLTGLRHLSRARNIVVSLGEAGAVGLSGERITRQDAIAVTVVDRIGAGDALAAGVIDGLLNGSLEEGLRTGTALAALALCQHGDVVCASRQEVESVRDSLGLGVIR
jgi:2-dehydro-3-deoxygluconokinase